MYNVLIVNADQLLGASITNLLMSERDIDLAGFTPLCPSEIIERLRQSFPDVLILANNLVTESVMQQIFEITKDATALKIILIDVDDNQVFLNGSQLLPIKNSSDLVKIVRSNYLISSHETHKERQVSIPSVQHRSWPKRRTRTTSTVF